MMESEDYPPFSFAPFGYSEHAFSLGVQSPRDEGQKMDQGTGTADIVPFQLPNYFYSTPALATGGGAEVLPAGMLNGANWLANNGCVMKGKEKLVAYNDPSYDDPSQCSTSAALRGVFDFDDLVVPEVSPTHKTHFAAPFQLEDGYPGSRRAPDHLQAQPLPAQALSSQTQEAQPASELILPPSKLHHPLNTTPLGLPVYSATGFDVLSILARVFNRPYPRIQLGPVDLTCSFVVVDTRRHDHPIIYCSPSFTKLTGYGEQEILGRNCRFLQSPVGVMEPMDQRPDAASMNAATYFKKNLTADKECQTIITNYRKDGTPFRNLVTVIPIPGGVSGGEHEEGDVVFHVGFQVDLTEQPKVIMENVTRGSYVVEYPQTEPSGPRGHGGGAHASSSRDKSRAPSIPPLLVSKEMKRLMMSLAFLRSIHITTSTNYSITAGDRDAMAGTFQDPVYCGNHPLHMMLLEVGPDFVHVVSLKGNFLYVAPAIRRVLGYEPGDMVGASIADIVHQDDVVPVMRELKESTLAAGGMESAILGRGEPIVNPRTVDLLFRAKMKSGKFVWMESRGRLHSEGGKGRKAIVLTGRAREMSHLTWETVACAGGVAKCMLGSRRDEEGEMRGVVVRQEFWGTLSKSGVFVTVGSGIKDVLGWEPEEFQGLTLGKLVLGASSGIDDSVKRLGMNGGDEKGYESCWASSTCRMRTRGGGSQVVTLTIFRGQTDFAVRHATSIPGGVHAAHLMYQVRLASAETYSLHSKSSTAAPVYLSSTSSSAHCSSLAASSPPTSDPPRDPRHPDLKTNILQAFDTSRGTSWQYEVKQLKFHNEKVKEEILRLEAALKAAKARKAAQAQAQGSSMSSSSQGLYGVTHRPQHQQYHGNTRQTQYRPAHFSAPPPHPELSINLSNLGFPPAAPFPGLTQGHVPSGLQLDPLRRGRSPTRQTPMPIAMQHSISPLLSSHHHPSPSSSITPVGIGLVSQQLPPSPQLPRRPYYPYPDFVTASSPHVQRVQHDVAAQMTQTGYVWHARGGQQANVVPGTGSSGGGRQTVGLKRSWTEMQGAGVHAPQPRPGHV